MYGRLLRDCGICAEGTGKSGIDPMEEASDAKEESVSGRAVFGEL